MDISNKNGDDAKWKLLLKSLKDTLKTKEFNKDEITELLTSYESTEEDWMKYVFFDEKTYTRNLVDAGNGIYNLILMAWNPAQGTCIHNHLNSGCFVKVLAGALREIRYETPEEGKDFTVIQDFVRQRDEVCYIDDTLGVHEMKNETSNQAITLHLYIPPFDICNAYDRETGAVNLTSVGFHSLYGQKFATEPSDIQPSC